MMLDPKKALEELRSASMDTIERSTALTWGARALASYQLSESAASPLERFRRFYEGENFRQEAFEHASMVEDDGELLGGVRAEIGAARARALAGLRQAAEEAVPAAGGRRPYR